MTANKMPWLRLYTDTVDNEKIRLLAFEDRWHYIALLCLKQQGVLDDATNPKLMERKIAVKLGVQLAELDEIKRRLSDVMLIDMTWHIIGWDEHQYKSDNSTGRVRKYREKKRLENGNGEETLQKRSSNVIDTDTDTEQRSNRGKSKRFSPPTTQDVEEYAKEKRYNIDAKRFVNFYESKGWMVGKNKMKSWKSAVANWHKEEDEDASPWAGAI